MRLGPKMITGIFLTLLGLSMILNTLFKIDLPVFRIFIACAVIYFGVRMMFGSSTFRVNAGDPNTAVFSSRTFRPGARQSDGRQEYNVVFSKGRIDLTGVSLASSGFEVSVNTVFGESIVEIAPGTPYRIESKAVFAESRMPDDNVNVVGSVMYGSESARTAPRLLTIRANTVFGSFRVEARGEGVSRPGASPSSSASF